MLVRHLVPRVWIQGRQAALGGGRADGRHRHLPVGGAGAAHDRGIPARREFAVLSRGERGQAAGTMSPNQPDPPVQEPYPDDPPAEEPPPEETPVRDPGPRRTPEEEPGPRDPAPPRAPVEEPPGRTRHSSASAASATCRQ